MAEMIMRFTRSYKIKVGVLLFLLILFFGFIGPLTSSKDPTAMVGLLYESPSASHILGTDNFGRDMFVALMHGTRTSLTIGLVSGLVATFIGTSLGMFAGYLGGYFDKIINVLTNLFLVIPPFIILLLVSISLETRSLYLLAILIGFTSWPWVTRSVRAQTLSLRNRRHVDIARISGFNIVEILLREILSYIMSYVFMVFIIQLASGIIQEATLSMLGLGPFNVVSLGKMLQWALLYESMRVGAWWAFIPPVIVISIITFSLKYVNNGMDEVFNPKLRK
ncbi:MAG: ABC transporter permease [Candidatus Acetothermia bacterium]